MDILIIDDDPLILHAYNRYLSHRKHTVFHAENGRVALELLRINPEINKVVIDAYMPEMDAFRFLKHIQDGQLYTGTHPDVYFITAWDNNHILERLKQENINQGNIKHIFKKPVDLEALHAALQGNA